MDRKLHITSQKEEILKNSLFSSKAEVGVLEPTVLLKPLMIVFRGQKMIREAQKGILKQSKLMMEFSPIMNKTTSKTGQESFLGIVQVLDIKELKKILFLTKAQIFILEVTM
jgi:hypothetical protein